MKIKNFIKDNKKIFVGILIGMLISSGSVYAASIISKDVSYDNSSSKLTSTNVQGAIDEVYKTATDKVAAAKKECPEGYECNKIICKRATTLHTEICSNSTTDAYCQGDGYALNDTITYGNLGINGILYSGDAFDCDVNGDGVYAPETERFYYVSDMTNGVTTDSNTAVLIYYNNVSGGVASNSRASAYDASRRNGHGPITAFKQLPTTSQWKNVSLNPTRNITDETETVIFNRFSYEGYAARFLTAQEVNEGCGFTVGSNTTGELSTKCKYLMENTKYSSDSLKTFGGWLESPSASTSDSAWSVDVHNRSVSSSIVSDRYGVRPAIEVSKDNISY